MCTNSYMNTHAHTQNKITRTKPNYALNMGIGFFHILMQKTTDLFSFTGRKHCFKAQKKKNL